MIDGLNQYEIAQLCDILRQFNHVTRAVLFGSRAMGSHRHNSDVDLALYGKDISTTDLLMVNLKIEETTLPYFFDFVIAHDANDAMLEHIHIYGKEIYVKNDVD